MNTVTFCTKLDSNVLKLYNIGNLIGKDVIISIIEIPKHKKVEKRVWRYIGSANLNKKLDNKNIRDFAYE